LPATGEYVIPQILGGGRSLMIGNVVVNDFLEVGDYPSGAALAMVMMGLLLVVVAVLGDCRRRSSCEARAAPRLRPRSRCSVSRSSGCRSSSSS